MAMEIPDTGHANQHTNHMKYWAEVKHKAEECVKGVLEGGNHPVTLHDAIGKSMIEHPEDWDALMDYCKIHGGTCHELNRLYRASATWLQAYHELEYKRLCP